ncbi:hypothetical protein Btru_049893 [Bulinus truncatus]|nr:hypothetical protein Btru_049893 [Bulinus truncatus]
MPTVAMSTVAMSTVAMPTAATSTVALPTVALPTVAMPTVIMSTVRLPTVVMLAVNAKCSYANCSYANCSYANCSYANCSYANCSYAKCSYANCSYVNCSYAKCSYANCSYANCIKLNNHERKKFVLKIRKQDSHIFKKNMKSPLLLTAIFVCVFLCVDTEKCKRRVCNVEIFSGPFQFPYMFMNPIYCTHMVLYRAEMNHNQEIEVTAQKYNNTVSIILELKKKNPTMKTIFAIQNTDIVYYDIPPLLFLDFVKMYSTQSLRTNFIRNMIKFVRDHKIEGIKIDVQPAEGGNKEQFTQLFKELKDAIVQESSKTGKPQLILSVGIPSDKKFLDKYYDVVAISKYVDMVDLATYSFQELGACVRNPLHHSPLYSQDPSSTRTIDFMSRYVAQKGVSKDLINVGLSVSSFNFFGIYDCGYAADQFFSSYVHVCDYMIKDFYSGKYSKMDKEVGRKVTWNDGKGITFYDDADTFKIKIKYVIDNGFSGVILSDGLHDYEADYYCKTEKHPLLRTVYDECRK